MRRMTHPIGLKRQRGRRFHRWGRRIRALLSGTHSLLNGMQLILTPPEQTFVLVTVGPYRRPRPSAQMALGAGPVTKDGERKRVRYEHPRL
jgi:hypothetical protein